MILGRSGMVNLLLRDWFDVSIRSWKGSRRVCGRRCTFSIHTAQHRGVAVEHCRLSKRWRRISAAMGFRLFRRVTLPLMLPGFVAGSLLTFIRAIDDLGTPLMLNYKNLLAPQAYLRITTIGMDDVDGYVVCVVLVVLSMVTLLAARKYLSLAEYATVQRAAPISRQLQGKRLALVWLVIAVILGIASCALASSSVLRQV